MPTWGLKEKSKPYKIPDVILAACDELNALVEANPHYIPAEQAANFLHMNSEGLRCSMEQGFVSVWVCMAERPSRV